MNGGERGNHRVGIGLVLLAGCATFNVFVDVRGKAGPPELGRNKLASFQVPGVTSSFMVMAALEDGVVK